MTPQLAPEWISVSPLRLLDSSKLAVNKASDGTLTIGFDPNQQTWRVSRFIVRIWTALEVFGNSLATFRRIYGAQALRERLGIPGAPKSQGLVSPQKRLDGPSQPGPEFDLSRDGPFSNFPGKPGVEHQGVGDFNRLAHVITVAKCYHRVKSLGSGDYVSLTAARALRWSGVAAWRATTSIWSRQ